MRERTESANSAHSHNHIVQLNLMTNVNALLVTKLNMQSFVLKLSVCIATMQIRMHAQPKTLSHHDVMGVKVGTNWGKCTFFSTFMFKIYMKAQKHARFHVLSSYSAYFYPLLHHNVYGGSVLTCICSCLNVLSHAQFQ